ncbi:MAG: hypothetical protein ACXWIU_13180, partial [Limisphaerales bacterium]
MKFEITDMASVKARTTPEVCPHIPTRRGGMQPVSSLHSFSNQFKGIQRNSNQSKKLPIDLHLTAAICSYLHLNKNYLPVAPVLRPVRHCLGEGKSRPVLRSLGAGGGVGLIRSKPNLTEVN